MAHILEDRVFETSTSTGTGDFTTSGAITGFKRFRDAYTVGDTFGYFIEAVDGSGNPSGEWETGIGAYSATDTVTRATVSRSSNSNAAVNFSAGTKRVAVGVIGRMLDWVEIASATPTGVNAVDFTSIPRTFRDLRLVAFGVSHDSGSNQVLSLAVSADGSTFSSGSTVYQGGAASVTGYGATEIPGYLNDTGSYLGGWGSLTTNLSIGLAVINGAWRCTGGISALRLAWGAGNFDAGTIKLYGR